MLKKGNKMEDKLEKLLALFISRYRLALYLQKSHMHW